MRKLCYFVMLTTLGCQQAKEEPSIQSIEWSPIETAKSAQLDQYHGQSIADPYNWLENESSDSTKEWVKQQNKVTYDYLEQIPFRSKLKEQFEQIWNYPRHSTPRKHGNFYYYRKNDGLQQHSVMFKTDHPAKDGEVFLDPNTFSEDASKSLGSTSFSHDSKLMAYSVSESGSDWREFYVKNVETGELLTDHIKWVKFSSANWYKQGFFYTRYDQPDERKAYSQQNLSPSIYYHTIGEEQSQDKLFYNDPDEPKISVWTQISENEAYLFLYKSTGASSKNALYFRKAGIDRETEMTPISPSFDHAVWVLEVVDDKFIAMTDANAPNFRIVEIDPNKPEIEHWREIIPEKEVFLDFANIVGGKIITKYVRDVTDRVYVFDFDGTEVHQLEFPVPGAVSGFYGNVDDSVTFYSVTSFTFPAVKFAFNLKTNEYSLLRESAVDLDLSEYTTQQVFFNSKDGTPVPMFLTHKKDISLNGQNPTLMYGYGGFNISIKPSFSVSRIPFLENGGIFVSVNLRGGSEYGEKWHEQGMLFNKQNVFDDFIAAAEYLIRESYTSPDKLAIYGRSNGGLLVGAVMNQRPDLFKVALPTVGVMDMLKFHKFTIGHAWVSEYGSSDDAEQFKNLLAYSPLHTIKDGAAYPATMVMTADHDDRVVPAHSFKFAARLQEAQSGEEPILIRIDTKAGHGSGKSVQKSIEDATDFWSFTMYHLGMNYE